MVVRDVSAQVLDSSRGIGMVGGVGLGNHDGLANEGHPPRSTLRVTSATVVIVKGIQVSKELVA